MKLLKKLNKWKHRNDLQWQIDHGYVKRGRTSPDVGKVGGGKIVFNKKETRKFRITNKIRKKLGLPLICTTRLVARHIRDGVEIDRREVINRKVTTAFVNFLVDNLITETSEWGDFKYHDSGEGNNAESPSDTTLQTPTGIGRATGTQVEGSQTYEYKSVGTITYDGAYSIVEHGLFSQAVGGTLMDRTVFVAIVVTNTDNIEFTFTIQFSAEA